MDAINVDVHLVDITDAKVRVLSNAVAVELILGHAGEARVTLYLPKRQQADAFRLARLLKPHEEDTADD